MALANRDDSPSGVGESALAIIVIITITVSQSKPPTPRRVKGGRGRRPSHNKVINIAKRPRVQTPRRRRRPRRPRRRLLCVLPRAPGWRHEKAWEMVTCIRGIPGEGRRNVLKIGKPKTSHIISLFIEVVR